MKCWLRMPSEMSRIHLSPPTIEIEKKLTEFISIEIIRNCKVNQNYEYTDVDM